MTLTLFYQATAVCCKCKHRKQFTDYRRSTWAMHSTQTTIKSSYQTKSIWLWSWRTWDIRLCWAVYSKQPRSPRQDVAHSPTHFRSKLWLWIWIHGAMSNHTASPLFCPCLIYRQSRAFNPHSAFIWSPFAHIYSSRWAHDSAWQSRVLEECLKVHPVSRPVQQTYASITVTAAVMTKVKTLRTGRHQEIQIDKNWK